MSVIVVGIEQRRSPLDLLERVAVTESDLPKALGRLRDKSNLSEAVILSTCLRTEVYAVVERFHDGVAELQEFLATISGSPVEALAEHLAVRFDDDVTAHLFTVAAGLDSAVVGESEVLGQVRRAWEKAQFEQVSGPVLGALFRHAVETGKRVRSETAIARGITSLSHGAVALAAGRREGGLAGARVLVVGAGEMGEGVTQALAGRGVASLIIANRTADRAVAIAAALSGEVGAPVTTAPLDDLGPVLSSSDVVFTSVGTTHPIIDSPTLEAVVGERSPSAPLLVIDLGVPRNVEPSAAGLEGLELLDMEVLRSAVADALSGRQEEVAGATRIVADEVERFRVVSRARDAAPMVSALRARVEEARRAEFVRQRSKRTELSDDQWEQVDAVTRAMVAKLLHQPTVVLKDAAGTPRSERLVEALRTLFDL
ncbi:MAG TPA: glutamyl-tRNA reductase [Acidimicrobiales bacterium]|nr:glutamyl-tRNA reductase [Acidimicrobiales bacterium]